MDVQELKKIVRNLKIQHGRVFMTEIGSHVVLWRELTRREYKTIMGIARSPKELEELICEKAILYPLGIDYRLAGIPGQLSLQIVELSGFGSLNQVLSYFTHYRNRMSEFERQSEVFIKTAFPTITFEEMLDWTSEHFMDILSKAEFSLKDVRGLNIGIKVDQETASKEFEDPRVKIQQAAANMRERGVDPMLAYGDAIIVKKPYIDMPLIGGTKQWKNGEVLNAIRKQISTVPK